MVILAKKPEVEGFLRRQFQERKTHKIYEAVVTGRPKLDAARIDLPIGRDLKHHATFRVDPSGRASETFYQVLESDGRHSRVELRPTTGRTHQLRVHMKYIGCPIVGDVVYGTEPGDRLYLHAKSLEITLPGGVRKVFEAPVPESFGRVF